MGLRRFLKGAVEKPLLIGGSTELELHKHFRLIRQLGHGSFATVYEAERLTDGRRYALKVSELQALSEADRAAVVQEIRLLASLSHTCIVAYHEAFADAGKLCVVTELVRGGDLGSLIAKARGGGSFFFERELWSIFLQIALGVQYLHRHHVLHRDLKPQNIMLTQRDGGGLVKIVDLGVAAHLQRVFDNVMVGTPHYMAPEMWSRKAYSYSADIWALGCILHELCTLRPTFLDERTRTEDDVRRKVLAGTYAPIPARLSIELSQLVAAMLQPDPKHRPTVDEILAMPQIHPHLAALPAELRQLADAATTGPASGAALLQKLRAAQAMPGSAHDMNHAMPASRYATGGGVVDLLCPLPFGAGQVGEGEGGSVERGGQLQRGGGSGELELGDVEELLQRRRSIMVGDLQRSLQLQQLQGHGSGTPAVPAANELARLERRPSPAPPASVAPGSQEQAGEACSGSGAQGGGGLGGSGEQGGRLVSRRSVSVAQVLYHDEPQKKLGERRSPTRAEELAALKGPLPRQPFEFLAPARATLSPPSSASARQQPQPHPPHPLEQQQGLQAPPTPHAAGSGPGCLGGASADGDVGSVHAERQPAREDHKKKKKKKRQGRLWRLMYGDSSSSAHQDS